MRDGLARPSIVDVARRAGVSKSTVSRVLTAGGSVRPATRARVEAVLREMDYQPNALARGLIWGRTRTLGLVVFDLPNPFFGLLVRGAEAAARARGYNVLIGDSAGSAAQQQECLAMLAERRVDGVLIAPLYTQGHEITAMRKMGARTVLVNSLAGDETISSVGGDNERGGMLAVRHLLSLGHRRIAFLGDRNYAASCRERRAGFTRAMAEMDVPVDPALVFENLPDPDQVRSAVHRLLEQPDPPTAIFAVNDQIAAAILQELGDQGYRVPDDISLVGYDDIFFAALLTVPLTTVAQAKEEQGRIAANLLIDQIEDPNVPLQRVVLQPRLVVRQSSGKAPVRASLLS